MASPKKYSPKPGDPVLIEARKGRFRITEVDEEKETATVRAVSGVLMLTDVPWGLLAFLDASQNAALMVQEATEGQ